MVKTKLKEGGDANTAKNCLYFCLFPWMKKTFLLEYHAFTTTRTELMQRITTLSHYIIIVAMAFELELLTSHIKAD